MTTAHRAQADGQTERQNRTLEDSLRCFTSYHGKDWNKYLPFIEYAHATLTTASTKVSPFEIDTGRKTWDPIVPTKSQNQKLYESNVENLPETIAVRVDDHHEKTYVIDKLLKKRNVKKQVEYIVKSNGYPIEESTWEPENQSKHVTHWSKLLSDMKNS
uniref:Uncharacterized protein AlNc14C18G1834 n=1 Tax=Albugo laibachii Nc14 TaxID=890382 RepID=F0W4L3_9STRA|nr:hypothetical protein HCAG_09237 [Albugo laibachii Nc14]|eukprot:CCA16047.1 hypothetical protein HCAG_09237 [Albugo laibachii Nc14]